MKRSIRRSAALRSREYNGAGPLLHLRTRSCRSQDPRHPVLSDKEAA